MASQMRVTDGRREWLATVNGSVVTIEGVEGTFTVTIRPNDRWAIEHGGHTDTMSIARTPDGVWIGGEGVGNHWQARPASSRTRHTAVDDDVRAPMSATVVRVNVAAGDKVAEGDILIVVEAMKMEMPLRAPRAAVVRVVHCREGELVQSASVLIDLE
ncbi:MAG: biotin/lipoyl-containing protein [Vicinamibacterales bacterium]